MMKTNEKNVIYKPITVLLFYIMFFLIFVRVNYKKI